MLLTISQTLNTVFPFSLTRTSHTNPHRTMRPPCEPHICYMYQTASQPSDNQSNQVKKPHCLHYTLCPARFIPEHSRWRSDLRAQQIASSRSVLIDFYTTYSHVKENRNAVAMGEMQQRVLCWFLDFTTKQLYTQHRAILRGCLIDY